MKRILPTTLLTLTALCAVETAYAAEALGLIRSANDQGVVYFTARCTDGKHGMVTLESGPPAACQSTVSGKSPASCSNSATSMQSGPGETCALPLGGESVCRTDWSLMDAAAAACL